MAIERQNFECFIIIKAIINVYKIKTNKLASYKSNIPEIINNQLSQFKSIGRNIDYIILFK